MKPLIRRIKLCLITLKNFLQKFFFGSILLEECESPINGKIKVCEDLFLKRRLMVGGLTQSGKLVEELWRKAFQISNLKFKISNILILGLGAGSVAKHINQKYPDAKITGIEIDPEIIRLGKKYFKLNETKNLDIKIADALTISKACVFNKSKGCFENIDHQSLIIGYFDLILVDLYLGDQVPKEVESEDFLNSVKSKLADNGFVIFNRLNYGNKKESTEKFGKILDKNFKKVESLKIRSNMLFFCS